MMVDHDWHPTPALRWLLGILQQRFIRECSEYREYNGVPRLAKWTEEDWRQVREASQAEVDAARAGMETPAEPSPCVCGRAYKYHYPLPSNGACNGYRASANRSPEHG